MFVLRDVWQQKPAIILILNFLQTKGNGELSKEMYLLFPLSLLSIVGRSETQLQPLSAWPPTQVRFWCNLWKKSLVGETVI